MNLSSSTANPGVPTSALGEKDARSEEPPRRETRDLRSFLRDLLALTKPGIVRMCLITSAGGLWLAPGAFDALTWISALLGSALAVAAANTFNMIWERDSDRLMRRTRTRPLASRRLETRVALVFAGMLSVLAAQLLALGTNPVTTGLAAFALLSYVLIYTPLKSRSPLALVIGAVPGAIPPLLGWTAVTGSIDEPGLALFAILFAWQMPHFLAIALYRKEDYARAGIRCVPVARSNRAAKWQSIAWSAALVPISFTPTLLGITGSLYLVVAALLSVVFFVWSVSGLFVEGDDDTPWARRFFFASLIYLPALTGALVLDVALW